MKLNIARSVNLLRNVLVLFHVFPQRISSLGHKATKITGDTFSVHMLRLNVGLNIFNEHFEFPVTNKAIVLPIFKPNHAIYNFIEVSMFSQDKKKFNTILKVNYQLLQVKNFIFMKYSIYINLFKTRVCFQCASSANLLFWKQIHKGRI